MFFLAHITFPTILFLTTLEMFGITYSFWHVLMFMFFSILPDTDYVFYWFYAKFKGLEYDVNTQYHHEWISHWPITYTPLIVWSIVDPSFTSIIITTAIYAHLVLDLACVGDGVMIFYPFSKKFYTVFSKTTTGYHGTEWLKRYKKLKVYKAEVTLGICLGVFLVVRFAF